jgi:hypothetical protein
MSDDDDPVPLKAGGEAGPELVRALRAFQELRPDPARRARVAERLSAGLAHAEADSGKLRAKLTPLRWGTLALALSALCWLGYRLTH